MESYKAAAKFINASPDEVELYISQLNLVLNATQISIGVSTTQLLHNLSTALDFQPGDELIISKLNHEANSAPWVRVAERMGLQVKWWGADHATNPTCGVEDLKSLLSEKTRIVACPHASNITGTITDVKAIAGAVHQSPRVCLALRESLDADR